MNNEEIMEKTEATLKSLHKNKVSAILLVSVPGVGVQTGATHLRNFETGGTGDSKVLEAILDLKLAIMLDQMPDDDPAKKLGEMLLSKDGGSPEEFGDLIDQMLKDLKKQSV